VPRLHRRGHGVDRCPIGDVAELVLGSDLRGQSLQSLFSAGEEDAVVALAGEGARDRSADSARSSGYDSNGFDQEFLPHTRTWRGACTLLPAASTSTASSVCEPLAAPARFHVAE
jgi:hypothetical protein